MANNARAAILKKIKQALEKPVPVPFTSTAATASLFQPQQQELELEFAENFIKLLGQFSYCENETELATQLNALFLHRKWSKVYCSELQLKEKLLQSGCSAMHATEVATCDAAITSCEQLVARTGSILLSTAKESGRTVSVYAPVHICIAYTDQLLYDIGDGLREVRNRYGTQLPSLLTLATGPSRTADIEKTLVVGVHGPKEVFCFLVDRSV